MTYKEISERIQDLSPDQAALFAAGCVHRVTPIVEACATEQTARLFLQLSELLWERGESARKAELVEALGDALELTAESAEEMHYWANHSLAMLFEAARSDEAGDAIESGEACCALGLNIAADFDAVVSLDEGGPEPELLVMGAHERLEDAAQREALDILTGGADRRETVERIKAASLPAVSRFTEEMAEFFRCAGWES